jgi:hypothetical protein
VEALPYLLRELKKRGYKIVQVVPATAERPKTVTDPGQWMAHSRQISRTPIFFETEPELPVPNPASFGFDVGSNAVSFLQKVSLARDTAWPPLAPPAPGPMTPVSMWPSGFDVTQASSPGRFQFPALGTHALDFDDSVKAWASRTPVDAETRGAVAVNEIQRLLELLPEENAPSVEIHNRKIFSGLLDGTSSEEGAAGPPARYPLVNAVIPRGAFP